MKFWTSFLFIIASVVFFSITQVYAETVVTNKTTYIQKVRNTTEGLTKALTTSDAIEEKPATFDSWNHRLDYIHDNFHNIMQNRTESTDIFLAGDIEPVNELSLSRFRVGIYIESELDKGFSLKFDPDFEAEIELPNTEKRWDIFITGKAVDEMPDTNPSEREKGFSAGVRRDYKNLPFKLDAGVRIRWLPEAFVALKWKTLWKPGNWRIIPSQKFYYETDEGFGEITALSTYYRYGKEMRGVLSTASAARLSEDTDGLEWSQSIRIGHIAKTIEKDYLKKTVRSQDTAHGVGLKVAAYGHINDETGVTDRYRVSLLYRRPLYKKWVYLEISPEVQWKNDNEWNAEHTLRIGFDMLFWGTPEM